MLADISRIGAPITHRDDLSGELANVSQDPEPGLTGQKWAPASRQKFRREKTNSIPGNSLESTPDPRCGEVVAARSPHFAPADSEPGETKPLVGINGFCKVIPHSRLNAILPLLIHGMRDHHKNGKFKKVVPL